MPKLAAPDFEVEILGVPLIGRGILWRRRITISNYNSRARTNFGILMVVTKSGTGEKKRTEIKKASSLKRESYTHDRSSGVAGCDPLILCAKVPIAPILRCWLL